MILPTAVMALRGRRRWLKVKRAYGVSRNGVYVILMSDSDRALNECALRHIDDFLDYRKGISAVILTTEEWVADNANQFSDRIAAVELITQRDCRCLSGYYYYYSYGFSEQFIVLSLRGVYGERLALAENVNGITKEDMCCLGLYIIRNWTGTDTSNG